MFPPCQCQPTCPLQAKANVDSWNKQLLGEYNTFKKINSLEKKEKELSDILEKPSPDERKAAD